MRIHGQTNISAADNYAVVPRGALSLCRDLSVTRRIFGSSSGGGKFFSASFRGP